MFEQETELIIKTTIQRIPRNASGTTAVKDILAADIPYPIKVFFRSDAEILLLDELRKQHKASRFNFEHHEVRSLQEQINSILVLNYGLNQEEFSQRLGDAVHLIINYLVRPQWTLAGVIFEKEQTISTQTLTAIMRYFQPYEYIRDIVSKYLSDRQIPSITADEFKRLIWKVDGEYVRRKSGDELARVMQPIFDFFDFPGKTGTNTIPIRVFIKYFSEKGLSMVLPRLEGEIAQGKTELNQRELGLLLEDVRRMQGAFQVEKTESEAKERPGRSDGTIDEPGSDPVIPAENTDLESVIGDADKRRFLKKIFKYDEKAYSSSLQSICRLTSWKQASKEIDEIFIRYEVDPYSSEAIRFTELIFNRFHPKK